MYLKTANTRESLGPWATRGIDKSDKQEQRSSEQERENTGKGQGLGKGQASNLSAQFNDHYGFFH